MNSIMKRTIFAAVFWLAAAGTAAAADNSLAGLIQAGQRDAALKMIAAGADVNAAQGDGTTPLHWAVYKVDADLVHRQPSLLLRLKAPVQIELCASATHEHGCQSPDHDAQDRHDDEHLHERVAALVPHHFALAWTSASARRASNWLLPPIPHRDSVRASTAMSVRRASAPCHQPIRAPETIHAFW